MGSEGTEGGCEGDRLVESGESSSSSSITDNLRCSSDFEVSCLRWRFFFFLKSEKKKTLETLAIIQFTIQ